MGKITLKILFVSLLISSWLFAGWPRIWQKPPIPPAIRKAKAAQVTIDNSIHTTSTSHLDSSPSTVFISETNGYTFYRDSGGQCVYSKTTNGGTSWGTAVTVDSQTDCLQIAVWYDRWTPGDNTGTLIHFVTFDSGDDDIWYGYLDISNNDSLATPINITSGLGYSGTLAVGTNHTTITKGTDGVLYAAVSDANGTGNIMARCSSTCTTATNWAVSQPASWTAGNDYLILVPMLSDKIMLLWWDISLGSNDIKYSIWDGSSWSTFAAIDTALDNAIYDASWGAAIDPSTGDVYLAYAANATTLGTDDSIRVKKYTSSWSSLTDVVTNSACAGVSNCGITGVKIAMDTTSGDLYVLYSAQSTPGTATTANVYFKKSTDGGSTWSSELGPVYSTNDDIYGARLSLSDSAGIQRIYATWYAATPDDLFGRPIAPLTFNQSAYRFFNNSDSTDVGTPLAVQNTEATLGSTNAAFRLRILLHVGVSDLFTSEQSFKLQFAQQSGTCDTGFSGETYADVTTSTVIAYNDNATPDDGDNLTTNTNDPTHDVDTIVNQTYEELNNFTNSVAAINSGQDGKWDFSLKDNNAPAETTYCLRVVKSDGTVLDTYTVIPQVTTASSATISVSVSDGNVAYGIIPKDTSKTTLASDMPPSGDMQTVSYDTNVTVNINIKGSDASGGGCTWVLAGTNGNDQYVHQFCNATDNNCSSPPTNYTALTSGYQTLKSGVSGQGTVDFHLRITMPTESSCYGEQSINVTIQAAQ